MRASIRSASVPLTTCAKCTIIGARGPKPRPDSNMSAASSLTLRSRLHLRSIGMKPPSPGRCFFVQVMGGCPKSPVAGAFVSNGGPSGTRAFAPRIRTPPSQARSGETLKTRHRRVSPTRFHLIGSSPCEGVGNEKAPLPGLSIQMVDRRGLEPRTLGLRVPCSTN